MPARETWSIRVAQGNRHELFCQACHCITPLGSPFAGQQCQHGRRCRSIGSTRPILLIQFYVEDLVCVVGRVTKLMCWQPRTPDYAVICAKTLAPHRNARHEPFNSLVLCCGCEANKHTRTDCSSQSARVLSMRWIKIEDSTEPTEVSGLKRSR